MSDTIGPDGLTDEERGWALLAEFSAVRHITLLATNRLAAERLAHAAEKAAHAETQAERDRLRAAIVAVDRECLIGKLWSHEAREAVEALRALLGEVKP